MTKIRRSYDEGCIAAHALDLIGDRWALLVARELMLGPRRFGALRSGLPGVSANILTLRLAEMEAAGLVTRASAAYALTPAGLDLWPVLRALCRWGAHQPGHDPHLFISPTALMLSMRAMCMRARAGAHQVQIEMGEARFVIETAPGRFHVRRGETDAALRFSGGTNAMAATVYGPQPLQASAAGLVAFTGDMTEGQAFLDLFHLR